VLLEGAQGTLLDIDHGTYPYVTSSSAQRRRGGRRVGLGPRAIDRVIGVAKAYATRVGHGPFPSEMPPRKPNVARRGRGVWRGHRPAPRCGWLDLPALRYAVRINGLDELVITKLDVLDDFDEIKVAERYEGAGKNGERFPAATRELARCRPVWKSFPGWKTNTSRARRWEDCRRPRAPTSSGSKSRPAFRSRSFP
jgi:adenylosuccinate synthase